MSLSLDHVDNPCVTACRGRSAGAPAHVARVAAADFWAHAAVLEGYPAVVVAAAGLVGWGLSFHEHSLDGVGAAAVLPEAVLHAAHSAPAVAVPAQPTGGRVTEPAAPPEGQSLGLSARDAKALAEGKQLSVAARKRIAAARLAAAERQVGPEPILDWDALREGVADRIREYRPRIPAELWARIVDATWGLLVAYQPTGVKYVFGPGRHIVDFLIWRLSRPGCDAGSPITLAQVADLDLVEEYLTTGMASCPSASKATARCVLRRAIRNLSAQPAPEQWSHSIQPPYTPAEAAAFTRLALLQPTASGRRSMCALVGLAWVPDWTDGTSGRWSRGHHRECDRR